MREFGIKNRPVEGGIIFQVGRYRVCFATRQITFGGQRIKLSWRCFEALQLLVEAKSEIVEREDFFRRLWPGISVDESSLNHCIAKLRKELGEPSEGGLIETVPRQGYRLTATPELIRLGIVRNTDAEAEQPESGRTIGTGGTHRKIFSMRLAVILPAVAVLSVIIIFGWQQWSRHQAARAMTAEAFHLVRQGGIPQIGQANSLFRRALELNPKLALAYAGLAEGMARSGDARPEQAHGMAERALSLDPNCAECKAIAGWIMMTREWKFREALRYLEDAAHERPGDARIRLWHSQILACAGRLESALAEINDAVALNPSSAATVTMRAGILYLSGRYEEAISSARQALGLQPGYSSALDWIYRSHMRLNQIEEAIAARAAMSASFVGFSPESRFAIEQRLTIAYRTDGIPGLVNKLLSETATKPNLDHHRYERATWRMWVGDQDGALAELENVFDFRPFHCIYLAVDPMFSPLHRDPRFMRLLSRMGLEAVARKSPG